MGDLGLAGTFETYTDKGGRFRFRLKASNGEIILASQGYASRSGLRTGIESVRRHGRKPECFQAHETTAGHRFNLIARNGRVIGTSEAYRSAAACTKGIASVGRHAPEARVEPV